MKIAYSHKGYRIVGTCEMIPFTLAELDGGMLPEGEIENPNYAGETEIGWDWQRQMDMQDLLPRESGLHEMLLEGGAGERDKLYLDENRNVTASSLIGYAPEEFVGGTVSHGTLLASDLIPAFLSVYWRLDKEAHKGFLLANRRLVDLVVEGSSYGFGPPGLKAEDPDDEWWESEEAGYVVEELTDELHGLCPPGWYFGDAEGNATDFGFWRQVELSAGEAGEEED